MRGFRFFRFGLVEIEGIVLVAGRDMVVIFVRRASAASSETIQLFRCLFLSLF